MERTSCEKRCERAAGRWGCAKNGQLCRIGKVHPIFRGPGFFFTRARRASRAKPSTQNRSSLLLPICSQHSSELPASAAHASRSQALFLRRSGRSAPSLEPLLRAERTWECTHTLSHHCGREHHVNGWGRTPELSSRTLETTSRPHTMLGGEFNRIETLPCVAKPRSFCCAQQTGKCH
jgi:hypothetical protein